MPPWHPATRQRGGQPSPFSAMDSCHLSTVQSSLAVSPGHWGAHGGRPPPHVTRHGHRPQSGEGCGYLALCEGTDKEERWAACLLQQKVSFSMFFSEKSHLAFPSAVLASTQTLRTQSRTSALKAGDATSARMSATCLHCAYPPEVLCYSPQNPHHKHPSGRLV